jgi:hypothetical protein
LLGTDGLLLASTLSTFGRFLRTRRLIPIQAFLRPNWTTDHC